ncbi:hypothetical protein GCM10027027_19800 [Neomicrococcus lactis]
MGSGFGLEHLRAGESSGLEPDIDLKELRPHLLVGPQFLFLDYLLNTLVG